MAQCIDGMKSNKHKEKSPLTSQRDAQIANQAASEYNTGINILNCKDNNNPSFRLDTLQSIDQSREQLSTIRDIQSIQQKDSLESNTVLAKYDVNCPNPFSHTQRVQGSTPELNPPQSHASSKQLPESENIDIVNQQTAQNSIGIQSLEMSINLPQNKAPKPSAF